MDNRQAYFARLAKTNGQVKKKIRILPEIPRAGNFPDPEAPLIPARMQRFMEEAKRSPLVEVEIPDHVPTPEQIRREAWKLFEWRSPRDRFEPPKPLPPRK